MKPRLPLPIAHTRCPLQIPRWKLVVIITLAFVAGQWATVWFILLVKGAVL
jgi:hypothetical protein